MGLWARAHGARRRRRHRPRGRLGRRRLGHGAPACSRRVALPPLAALAAIAWVAAAAAARARARRARALRARGAPDRAATCTSPLASLAFAATVLRRGAHVPRRSRRSGPLARLRHADEAADHVAAAADRRRGRLRRRAAACRRAARSRSTMVGLALACGGASALNHYLDRDIDKLMGSRTEQRPVASGRVPRGARARVRARALGVLVRAARLARQPADRAARARRATSSTCSSTRAG